MSEEQKDWGFEKFTYTREQLRHFVLMFLKNNGLCRATLESSEVIWPGRHYSFAAYWYDVVYEHSIKVAPQRVRQFTNQEDLANLILDSVWESVPVGRMVGLQDLGGKAGVETVHESLWSTHCPTEAPSQKKTIGGT